MRILYSCWYDDLSFLALQPVIAPPYFAFAAQNHRDVLAIYFFPAQVAPPILSVHNLRPVILPLENLLPIPCAGLARSERKGLLGLLRRDQLQTDQHQERCAPA